MSGQSRLVFKRSRGKLKIISYKSVARGRSKVVGSLETTPSKYREDMLKPENVKRLGLKTEEQLRLPL